ncbi:MAG TPA: hypothetical protein VGS07_24095 [Thermoanaerobaculia bacterium]|jgi:hypothetical protein|nr:hypothetical protein [Thermoanaerobaculia bacterium]
MAAPSAECENLLRQHLANPFLVLGLEPDASRDELERQGAKLLAMLAAGVRRAAAYSTPRGRRDRTPEMVRAALAELRDPARRLLHEWWAQGLAGQSPGAGTPRS